jgi:hypothetical protein
VAGCCEHANEPSGYIKGRDDDSLAEVTLLLHLSSLKNYFCITYFRLNTGVSRNTNS